MFNVALWLILLTQFLVEMSTLTKALDFSARVEDLATTPQISSLTHWWYFCRRQNISSGTQSTVVHCSFFSHLAHFIASTVQKVKVSSYPPGGAEQQRIPITEWAGWIPKPCHNAQHASGSHLSLSANSRTQIQSAVPLSCIGLICVTLTCPMDTFSFHVIHQGRGRMGRGRTQSTTYTYT